MAVWDDTDALAAAIREARGALSRKAAGAPIGVSYKTWMRWEEGKEASIGDTPEKRYAVAIQVAAATGRGDLLGLTAPVSEDRVYQRLDLLDEAVLRLAREGLEQDELDDFRQWWTTDPRSEEEGPGGASE